MYYLEEMCCLCLRKFHLNDTKFTDFENISSFLPNVSSVLELDEENMICDTCHRTVENICDFVNDCLKNVTILQSYKSKLKGNVEKKRCNIKIQLKQETNLKMNEKNQVNEQIIPLSDTFPNSDVEEIQFLSENEIKKEVENDPDLLILSINNSRIKEEIEELYIKEELSGDMNEDVLEYSNPFLDKEDYVNAKNENNPACFVTLSIGDEEIKTEIDEAYKKKECFSDIYENILEYSNQQPDIQVGAAFDVAIEHTSELERESLSTITAAKKPVGGNELNFDISETGLLEQDLHTSMSPYTGDICNKSYVNIEHHFLHKNPEEKLYICPICQKTFSKKSHLVDHEFLHTGDKPFSCPVCKKSFARKSNFVRHELTHAREKPYSCDTCKSSFTSKSQLIIHERHHTGEKPYSCQVCDKSFAKKSHLVDHERLHTGEKPHTCQVCKKSFVRKSDLNKHERLHTGEKDFTCQVCERSFTQKSNLIKHERVHTGEKLSKF